jgi:hypothetical protein
VIQTRALNQRRSVPVIWGKVDRLRILSRWQNAVEHDEKGTTSWRTSPTGL